MKKEKKRIWKKQAVSISLATVLAFSGMGNIVWAEQSTGQTTRDYRVGTMQVLFEDMAENGSEEYVKVHVLHDQNSDLVWMNAAEFVGYLEDYTFVYNKEERSAEITVRDRQIGFQPGGSIVGYKIGENEGFYRMENPAVKYDEEVWIPADEFFHFIGSVTVPIAKDGDTTEFNPAEDYLLVMNPQKNVIDVLGEIFEADNGVYWMFDYEGDFSQYSENVDEKFEKAKDALGIYETLTLDLARIADNMSFGLDATGEYLEKEFGIENVDYDAKEGIKDFIDKMLNPSESLVRAGEEHIGATLNVVGHALSTVDTSTEYMEEVTGTIDSVAGNLQAALKKDYDELKNLISGSKKLENVIETGTLAASVGLQVFGVLQRIVNHDESVLKAMDYYLKQTDAKNPVYTELGLQFAERSNDYIYAAYESAVIIVKQSAEKFAEAALKKAGLSVVSFIGSVNNLLWYALEQTGWMSSEKLNRVVIDIHIGDKKLVDIDTDTSLATVDEAKAMRMSVYGIMYELDALKELGEYYFDILVGNGYRSYRDLTACAYMALNYLQACYVTTEAALSAFAHANVEDTENADDAWISYRTKKFADTEQYKITQKKLDEIAEMITVLSEALPHGTDLELTSVDETTFEESLSEDQKALRDRLFGVIVSGNDFNTNDLTYDVFLNPSTMEDGKDYGFYAPVFDGADRIILPLVTFGGVINNGGKFVGYQGNTYYWNFNQGSIGTEGILGSFDANEGAQNQLVCRAANGKETVLLNDAGKGAIYISGNKIYYEKDYTEWACCTLDGEITATYPSTKICGADENYGVVIADDTNAGLILISSDGTKTTITDSHVYYVGTYNGIVYYTSTNYTDRVVMDLYGYNIGEKSVSKIGSVTTNDLGMDYLPDLGIVDAIFTEDCMYAVIGCYQGTGMFFEGCPYRIKYDGGMLRLAPYLDFPKIYLEEKENGEHILYYADGISYSNVGHGDSYATDYVQALNLMTGEVKSSSLVLSNVNDAVIIDGSIQTLLGNDGKYVEIVTPELLERMTFADLTNTASDPMVLIRDFDVVDNMAYVTLGRMHVDESLSFGWRTGYRRDEFKTFAVEIGTTKSVQLDEF